MGMLSWKQNKVFKEDRVINLFKRCLQVKKDENQEKPFGFINVEVTDVMDSDSFNGAIG